MSTFASGLISIPNEITASQGGIISSVNGSLVDGTVATVKSGEGGAVVADGTMIFGEKSGTSLANAVIYNPSFSLIASPNPAFGGTWLGDSPFASDFDSTFYMGFPGGAGASKVRAVSKTGTLGGTTWSVGSLVGMTSLAVDTANTTLFFAGGFTTPLRTFNILTNLAGPNLVSAVTNFGWMPLGLLVIPGTSTLLAMVQPNVGITNYEIRRYDFPSGALIQTYALSSDASSGSGARIALDLDAPSVAFWTRTFEDVSGLTSTFTQVNIATGFVVTRFIVPNDSTDPTQAPKSCPFFAWSNNGGGGGGGTSNVFVGTAATMPIRRERTVPIPVADGNARQTISRLEVQFQPGTGIVDDPLGEPKFMLQVSWDHGKTWSNERLMNAGREGRYLTRAYVNIVGQGRYPVVRIVTSDTFLPIMTGCSVWITESAH